MGDSSVPSDKLGESPAVELTGKIMVVAIIILFMVVVFVLFLHLYAKWFSWRMGDSTAPQHRRRRRRRFVFAPGQDPANNGALRRGLEPSVLRSLPVLVFQAQDFKEGLECAVCLCEVVEGEKARLLPKCNHWFHVDCIDMWFQSHSTCPLCRNPVTVNNAHESSEAENSANMGGSESESPVFPTNVFIWGNQTRVSSNDASLEESTSQPTCTSSSSAATTSTSTSTSSNNNNNRLNGTLVIDIPSEISSSSLSPSASRFAEDELKSPMAARLRSLKRLLSREKRLNPCSPSSIDVEQAVAAHS